MNTKLHFTLHSNRHVQEFIAGMLEALQDLPMRSIELRAEIGGGWSVLVPPSLGVVTARVVARSQPSLMRNPPS